MMSAMWQAYLHPYGMDTFRFQLTEAVVGGIVFAVVWFCFRRKK